MREVGREGKVRGRAGGEGEGRRGSCEGGRGREG